METRRPRRALITGRLRGRSIHRAALPVGTGLRTVPVTCDGQKFRRSFALRSCVVK